MGRETSSAHVDTAVFLQLREENTVLKRKRLIIPPRKGSGELVRGPRRIYSNHQK